MDREALLKTWNEAGTTGLWAGAWSKMVAGLTPEQAAWRPQPGRNSIWQIVEHVIYWRGVALARTAGERGPTEAEAAPRNFPMPASVNEAAWNDVLQRLDASQQRVAATISAPATGLEQLQYLVPHDCYHMGQISYLRALQGLPPVE